MIWGSKSLETRHFVNPSRDPRSITGCMNKTINLQKVRNSTTLIKEFLFSPIFRQVILRTSVT